jgi:hypothetical protein
MVPSRWFRRECPFVGTHYALENGPDQLRRRAPANSDSFFPLAFFLVSPRAFFGGGGQTHHTYAFTTSPPCHVPCRKLFPKIDKNFDVRCQFFLDFFLNRGFGCFSAMGVPKHFKKRFAKQIVSKGFYKKIDQKSQTDFFSTFLLCFWAFLGTEYLLIVFLKSELSSSKEETQIAESCQRTFTRRLHRITPSLARLCALCFVSH